MTTVDDQKDKCCNDPVAERHFELKTDSKGKATLNDEGHTELVAVEAKAKALTATPRAFRTESAEVIQLAADCTTGPTGTGGRTACWSEWSVATLPAGYAYDKEAHSVAREIEYGSENNIYVVWEDYVRIIPNRPFTAPRTLKVQVHARSGRDQGERGRTKVTVTAPYFSLT